MKIPNMQKKVKNFLKMFDLCEPRILTSPSKNKENQKVVMFELCGQDLNCTGQVGPENQKFNFLLDKLEPGTR